MFSPKNFISVCMGKKVINQNAKLLYITLQYCCLVYIIIMITLCSLTYICQENCYMSGYSNELNWKNSLGEQDNHIFTNTHAIYTILYNSNNIALVVPYIWHQRKLEMCDTCYYFWNIKIILQNCIGFLKSNLTTYNISLTNTYPKHMKWNEQ